MHKYTDQNILLAVYYHRTLSIKQSLVSLSLSDNLLFLTLLMHCIQKCFLIKWNDLISYVSKPNSKLFQFFNFSGKMTRTQVDKQLQLRNRDHSKYSNEVFVFILLSLVWYKANLRSLVLKRLPKTACLSQLQEQQELKLELSALFFLYYNFFTFPQAPEINSKHKNIAFLMEKMLFKKRNPLSFNKKNSLL